ncbi:MAG: FkbM family methyltransferase [Armatimonadota bacterium]
MLRLPLRLIPAQTVVPIMQGKLKGRKWIVGSGNHGYWLGSYEFHKRSVFERTVNEGTVVFDIGTHVGFYTLLASVLVGPSGKVFAFEPLPSNLRYLKEHLRWNSIENVTVLEAAVLDRSGEALFDEGPNSSMGRISPSGKVKVKTVALDELVGRGELPLPDYIKMDIEGAEMLALSGAKSVLAKSRPTLFLATHGMEIHQECCGFLQSLDYQLQAIDGMSLEQCSELLAFRKEAG